MTNLLEDIDPDEVSVVKRGANQRPWLILKAEDDGNMHVDGELADVLAVPTDNEGLMTDRLRKEGVSDAGQRAAVAAVRLLQGFEDEFNIAQVMKAGKIPYDPQMDTDNDAGSEDDNDEDDIGKDGNYDEPVSEDGAARDGSAGGPKSKDGKASGAAKDGGASGAAKDGRGTGQKRDGSGSSDDDVNKRDFSADQRDSAALSGAALPDGSFPIENTSDLKNAVRAIGRAKDRMKAMAHIKRRAKALGATNLLPKDWGAVSKSNEEEEHGMSEGTVSVPVRKEDGSWDTSSIADPDARTAWESVLKEQKDLQTQIAKAEASAAEANEKLRAKEFVQKAEEYGHVAPADELGEILKQASEKLEPEAFEKLEGVLKAAEGKIAQSSLFKEFGSSARGETAETADAYAKIEKMADELITKSDITRDQAIDRVLQTAEGKRFYSEYLASAFGGGVS